MIDRTVAWLGSRWAIAVAISIIIVWALSGPFMAFSGTWQLLINTFTTLVTFVMVFVIQNSSNRNDRALQTKLDDLIVALEKADDDAIGLEDQTDARIREVQDRVRSNGTGV